MATNKIIKTLRFSNNDAEQYQINAVKLDGHTWSEIDARFSTMESFDALRYMGTIAAGSTLPEADKGDVYKVSTAGTIAGAKVEIGDMLICNTDDTSANTPANWDIIQGNVDIDALLDHTHEGTITLVRTNKDLNHDVTLDTEDITASFTNGAAIVTGNHGHTGSGSVIVTPQGTIQNATIKPAGTVTLTTPTTKGTGDAEIVTSGTVKAATTKYMTGVSVADHDAHKHTVSGSVTIKTGTGTANYTPAGDVGTATTVTDVSVGDITISEHDASSNEVSAGTPSGSVGIENQTAGGTVASHSHNVEVTPQTASISYVSGVSGSYTAGTNDDGILTFIVNTDSKNYVTGVTATEDSVAPAFTGVAHSHTAAFTGTALPVHSHTITVSDHDAITPNVQVTTGTHDHTFTGTGVQLVATHNITTQDATLSDHVVTPTVESTAHTHEFTGGSKYIHATFAGTEAEHKHDFIGTEQTHAVTVEVEDYNGNFSGTATGNVTVTNGDDVVKGVTIGKHTVSTADSATIEIGPGTQE